jgi:uncharacterized protein (DUF433 family)
MEHRGAYTAERAASLSGVPKSTVHYWARQEILVPSISATRIKLWSYADLMGLRTIYWLRQTKDSGDGPEVPRTSMQAVRRALDALGDLDLELWTEDGGPSVAVDRAGRVVITPDEVPMTDSFQHILDRDLLNLVAPFPAREAWGPDLRAPRPRLRIVPGKLSGSPHIERTRIETIALAALAKRGLNSAKVYRLYPVVDAGAIDEALDLEKQLDRNLAVAA